MCGGMQDERRNVEGEHADWEDVSFGQRGNFKSGQRLPNHQKRWEARAFLNGLD